MAATRTNCSALRALAVEYKSLQEEPVEGFCVKLVNEDNLFEWEVAIFGPPDTLYMGGCFKVRNKQYFDHKVKTNLNNNGVSLNSKNKRFLFCIFYVQ